MIAFEEAKNLKAGDVVFADGYRCSVVKIKVDKKARTVAITYTDGSPDDFEGANDALSLRLCDEPAADGDDDAAQADAPAAKPAPKPRRRLTPMPKPTADPVARLKACVARHSEWRSLDWFEQDRVEFAQAVSGKLGIPIEEFEDTTRTALFHFMTLAMAIAKWLRESGWREIRLRDEALMNQHERLARSKAMAGILVRLFSHKFVGNLGDVQGLGGMMKAFAGACDVSEAMLGHVLTAHTYVRQSTLIIARHLADGSEGGSPVKVDFFGAYREFLENDEDGFMPSGAVVDACLQLSSTLQFLHDQADLPASLDALPEDGAQAHEFLRNYLMAL